MKKQILFFAVAALALASCSSENDVVQSPDVQQTTADNGAVNFDSYINRTTTRSGATGTMSLSTANTRKLQDTGFGVFGYYTNNEEYNGLTIPDFFYNQKVSWKLAATDPETTNNIWYYTPVKYWPNEYGNSAIADDNDKVSYFAYAPYVEVVPGSGKPADQTYGITQLSRNSATGDPYVKYIASFDWQKAVDLLWGVVPDDKTNWNITSGQTQTLQAGMPWLNIERPLEAKTQDQPVTTTQRVKFNFRHALSKLNVQIDYDADMIDHNDATNELDASTRVYIRSVSFTGFSTKGALNLKNIQPNTPLWLAYDATSDLEIGEVTTLNDGRKDGKEGVGGAVAPNEKNVFINPSLIQQSGWNSDNKGVENTAQNLFAYPGSDKVAIEKRKTPTPGTAIDASSLSGFAEAVGIAATNDWSFTNATNAKALLEWPVMVIPNGDEVKVTIVYDVETVDKNLALTVSDGSTLGSSIENNITKTITFAGDKNYMEAGKKYVIKLHIGLNSVKFDAAVTDWDATSIEGDAWLPDNVVSYQAPGVYNFEVAAATPESGAFKLTGFAPKETVKNAAGTAPITYAATTYTASNTGEVAISSGSIKFAANTTVLKKTTDNAVVYTGSVSGKQVILNLIQNAAQPDGSKSTLTFGSTPTATGTFALKNASGIDLTGAVWTGNDRNVQIISATRNGVPMTELGDSETVTTTTQFKTGTGSTITLNAAPVAGEVFIFTIKAGDAGEFTVKTTI